MCGIVAMFSEGGEVLPEALDRAVRSLHHRGPDGQRQWVDSSRGIGLGHARLSVIDLEGGTQPLANEDESIHAVVNGELYDFERIRRELEARGHRFRTHSDSEVLLHLYEDHGPSCVDRLRGEFAFVLYDARNDLLFAGRDRFGIKPLFYGRHHGVLMFASEAKALFAAGQPAKWDGETFAVGAALAGSLEDESFFAGVKQVPAGSTLLADRRGARIVKYWDFDYPLANTRPAVPEAEQLSALTEAIDEAVRLRLRADVPVACYLSGGIDSCAVLGFAARHARTPIRAFTLSFDRPEYDEEPIAREMALLAGAHYSPIAVTQEDFARDFSDAIWHAERPFNNANSVAKFRLSRAVREAGIKVVLTGEGSDEIFAGYPHFRRDLFLQSARDPVSQRNLAALEKGNSVWRGMLMPDGEALPLEAVRGALDGFAPTWLDTFASAGKKMHALLAPEFALRASRRDSLAVFMGSLEVNRQVRGRHALHQSMYLWSKSMLPNYILSVLGDRMEMAHSIEGRLPFLDHHVVELSTRLSVDRLIRGTAEKYLLREAARPFVTDTVYRRQKHPFFAPPTTASPQGPLHEMMQDTLRGPALRAVPFYDSSRIVALLDALPNMDEASRGTIDSGLLVLLSTCVMQQRFGLNDVA